MRVETATIPRPDWAIVGGAFPERKKVALLASKELTGIELKYEQFRPDYYELLMGETPKILIALSATMKSYVVIVADTYEAAFQALFKVWSPEPDEPQPEIEPAERRALT